MEIRKIASYVPVPEELLRPPKQQVEVVTYTREQLQQERDELLVGIGDCPYEDCPHHEELKQRYETVEWLLLGAE